MDAQGTTAPVLTVTQLNNKARALMERNFTAVAVAGEISNLKMDRSGHRYFALKDAGGVISAAIFRGDAARLTFPLKDGLQVIAVGNVSIYGPQGRYQIVVRRMTARGAGQLQAQFEELKQRLLAEGLFDQARKRRLPSVPRRVAVVTSPHGAVLRDILHVSARRFPNAQILLMPIRTQGPECVPNVVGALQRLNTLAPKLGIDVIIVARGGGSLEDLWGFNDERVARAIHASALPVVSAVGHETDFTIADFVADVRAPTPSAAAELVFPHKSELIFRIQRLQARLTQAVRRDVARQRYRLRALRAELGDGTRFVYTQTQKLSSLQTRIESAQRRRLATHRQTLVALERRLAALHPRVRLNALQHRLHAADARLTKAFAQSVAQRRARIPALNERIRRAFTQALQQRRGVLPTLNERIRRAATQALLQRREHVPVLQARIIRAFAHGLKTRRERLAAANRHLDALSPLGVLNRGYGIVLNASGHAVRRPQDAPAGERLDIRLAQGRLAARVERS